jgi:hypothetical protein
MNILKRDIPPLLEEPRLEDTNHIDNSSDARGSKYASNLTNFSFLPPRIPDYPHTSSSSPFTTLINSDGDLRNQNRSAIIEIATTLVRCSAFFLLLVELRRIDRIEEQRASENYKWFLCPCVWQRKRSKTEAHDLNVVYIYPDRISIFHNEVQYCCR